MKDSAQAFFGLLVMAFGGWVMWVALTGWDNFLAFPFTLMGLAIIMVGGLLLREGSRRVEEDKNRPVGCDRCGGCDRVRPRR